ncbi:Uncharacterised protein [Mycobacteroides abscessus subsp. abscessus]|nr:Uncharacterised protein [Mycobacteroides abscessus subsp. abscessus]
MQVQRLAQQRRAGGHRLHHGVGTVRVGVDRLPQLLRHSCGLGRFGNSDLGDDSQPRDGSRLVRRRAQRGAGDRGEIVGRLRRELLDLRRPRVGDSVEGLPQPGACVVCRLPRSGETLLGVLEAAVGVRDEVQAEEAVERVVQGRRRVLEASTELVVRHQRPVGVEGLLPAERGERLPLLTPDLRPAASVIEFGACCPVDPDGRDGAAAVIVGLHREVDGDRCGLAGVQVPPRGLPLLASVGPPVARTRQRVLQGLGEAGLPGAIAPADHCDPLVRVHLQRGAGADPTEPRHRDRSEERPQRRRFVDLLLVGPFGHRGVVAQLLGERLVTLKRRGNEIGGFLGHRLIRVEQLPDLRLD